MKECKLKAAPAALRQEIKNQKAPKAKRILVGIDTGLGNNQASRKVDNAAIGPVQNLRSETEMALYIDKQLELAEEVVVVYVATRGAGVAVGDAAKLGRSAQALG